MGDQRPDVPQSLDLDLDKSSHNDPDADAPGVRLRRDGDTLRRMRERKKERTPTAIVSEAFTFLNDHQISIVDAVEEGCLRTEEEIHNDLEFKSKICSDKTVDSEREVTNNDGDDLHDDRFLSQTDCHLSKDSGFASLERHLYCSDTPLCEFNHGDLLDNDSTTEDHLSTTQDVQNSSDVCQSDVENNVCFKVVDTTVHDLKERINIDSGCADLKDSDLNSVNLIKSSSDLKTNLQTTENGCDVTLNDNADHVLSSIVNHVNTDNHIHCDSMTDNMKTCSNNVDCETIVNKKLGEPKYKENEMANDNENDSKLSESGTGTVLDCIGDGVVDADHSNVKSESETGIDAVPSDENVISCTRNIENCDKITSEDVCSLDGEETKNDETTTTVVNLDNENLISNDEAKDAGGRVDMRRKPDVIPASPVKPKGCDSSVKSSKTGLLLEANPATEMISDDSSDEDTGIYAESFRRSNWVRVSQDKKKSVKKLSPNNTPVSQRPTDQTVSGSVSVSTAPVDDTEAVAGGQDDVFTEPLRSVIGQQLCHKRSDSVTTTDSEQEFQTRYILRRKCLIQRADSQQEYHRLSARIYGEDKEVTLERNSDTEDLGLHLLDSHPTYITSVDAGSLAEKAGIVEGQILVSVNDLNVLLTDHNDIITLIQEWKGPLKLVVASTDFQPIRDLQAPVISGHMYKLGTSSLVRIWKKRFFVLRNDNCLYYYKSDQDLDPLGALPLSGYTISRHTDTSKDFCFKAEKYRARTYYFMTENRDQLTEWVAILTDAAMRSKKQKESSSFMSVSSHNVSLPALDIRRPECSGHLLKLSPHSRSWRRRYCLLKDACIYYYKDVNSFSALGVAHLHGYTVDVAGHAKKKNSFSLRPPDAKMRQFVFGADNETDKKRWVEAVIHSIQRWVPVDKGSDC